MSNTSSLQLFEVSLADFAEAIDVALPTVVKRITYDLHGRITKRTPVDTGRARASWDVKVGSPSNFVPPETKGSVRQKGKTSVGSGQLGNDLGSGASQGGAAKDIGAEVAGIDGTAPVFITTALDYVQYLEKGSSKQAPAGMVMLSIAEVEIELETILTDLLAKA